MSKIKNKKEYVLTWLNKNNIKDIMRIEKDNDNEWNRQDFLDFHDDTKNVIIVMQDMMGVVGFIALSLTKDQVEIVKLGLHKSAKTNIYRDKLINHIKKISFKSRDKLYIKFIIKEKDDDLRNYLISIGFLAIKLLKNYFKDQDGYVFRCCNT